jgi:hypothetical protein
MCVYVSSTTLERLQQFQPNLVHMTIYIYIYYIYRNECMCVCGYVCYSITLERLEQFQSNLVHMTIYKNIILYFIYIIYIEKWMFV